MYNPTKNIPTNNNGGIFYSTKLFLAIKYTIKIDVKEMNILAAKEKTEFTD